MKNKITRNLGLKILSLIVGFLFWLVIVNVTDPVITRTFDEIPVQILNENIITNANQVYEVEAGDQVKVTVKGKRSFVETLTKDDFVATANMSDLSKVNAISIDVRLNKVASSDVEVDWGHAVLKVKLEKRVTKKFQVVVEHQGELSDGYVLGNMTAKPNIVEVSCGESKFKEIDHVGVMVSLNGESENFEKEYRPILYDKEGEILDNTNVTFSNDMIKVSTQVHAMKEIPVYVDVSGTPAEGYRLVQTDFRPETVQVTGTAEALGKNLSIKVPISVENAKKDVEKEIELTEYLPEGLTLAGDITTISVRCQIEKNGQRTFTFTSTDIAVKNLQTDCTVEFAFPNESYSVTVTGKESDLDELAMSDLGAYVDLANLMSGSYTLNVQFALPASIKVKNQIKVKLVLQMQDLSAGGNSNVTTPVPDQNIEN